MQNAEGNPSQAQQNRMAAKSPVKTPATGTSSPNAATQAAEFGRTSHAGSAEAPDVKNADPLPSIDLDDITRDSADPVQRANSRIVSVDSAAMDATDDTVDTDGKSLEAKRNLPVWHDNVISSNATLENNVRAPAEGLGGIDSRPTGNMPDILPRDGFQVVYCGTVYEQQFNGARAEHVIRLERNE